MAVQKFHPGDSVKVEKIDSEGHVRTPGYIQGKCGVIERFCGYFPNPEQRSIGLNGLPEVPLYRVRFSGAQLFAEKWNEVADSIDVEVFEHWLREAKNDI
ncbi:MAG: hypothetical protein ACI8P9_005103 [Parasphingorhabdus sp.]